MYAYIKNEIAEVIVCPITMALTPRGTVIIKNIIIMGRFDISTFKNKSDLPTAFNIFKFITLIG